MGNPQHLEWLLEGRAAWNARRAHEDFKPDFENLDIRGAFKEANKLTKLERIPLDQYDLRRADLGGGRTSGGRTSGGADLGTLYWDVGSKNGATPQYTDLSLTIDLEQPQLDRADGDRGVILPKGLDYPKHWPEPKPPEESDATDQNSLNLTPSIQSSPIRQTPPVVEVAWSQGTLDATFLLTAQEPTVQVFDPAVPSAEIDLLSSLGKLAQQASDMLGKNTPDNAVAFTGDATQLFDEIAAEVDKPNGLVLSFVLEANISAIELLCASDASEALREVDAAFVRAFLDVAHAWRKQSAILKAAKDPTNSEIVPVEKLDTIEAAENRMIALITAPENAECMGPSLPGVTRDMALYPWDPDDLERGRRMRAAALGTLASQIWQALKSPPDEVKSTVGFYAALVAAAAAVLSLFAT